MIDHLGLPTTDLSCWFFKWKIPSKLVTAGFNELMPYLASSKVQWALISSVSKVDV